MVKRLVVGAHYGLRDWLVQRATAVVMMVYTLLLLAVLVACKPAGYEAWRALFASGVMQFMTFLFLLALFWHAWIGIRDIWMDYIKPAGVRLALHIVTACLLLGYTGWAAKILWSL